MTGVARGLKAWLCVCAFAATMTLMMLSAVGTHASEPTGDFAVYAQCPRFDPQVTLCLYSNSSGGSVRIGSSSITLSRPIVLQGGIVLLGEGTEEFVAALNGQTLGKAQQSVSGGLTGLIPAQSLTGAAKIAFQQDVNQGLTSVGATTELAAPASAIELHRIDLIYEEGIAIRMPIKIHLENPFLGPQCYLGSNADPIVLNLTTGITNPPPPNRPTKGSGGAVGFLDEAAIALIAGTDLIDDAFSVPRSSGCGGSNSSLVGPLLDAKVGLPSAAGRNTFTLLGSMSDSTVEGTIKSEK